MTVLPFPSPTHPTRSSAWIKIVPQLRLPWQPVCGCPPVIKSACSPITLPAGAAALQPSPEHWSHLHSRGQGLWGVLAPPSVSALFNLFSSLPFSVPKHMWQMWLSPFYRGTWELGTWTDEPYVITCWFNDRATFRTQSSYPLTSSQTERRADLRKHDPRGEIILLGGQLPGHWRKFPQPVSGINLGRSAEKSAAPPRKIGSTETQLPPGPCISATALTKHSFIGQGCQDPSEALSIPAFHWGGSAPLGLSGLEAHWPLFHRSGNPSVANKAVDTTAPVKASSFFISFRHL